MSRLVFSQFLVQRCCNACEVEYKTFNTLQNLRNDFSSVVFVADLKLLSHRWCFVGLPIVNGEHYNLASWWRCRRTHSSSVFQWCQKSKVASRRVSCVLYVHPGFLEHHNVIQEHWSNLPMECWQNDLQCTLECAKCIFQSKRHTKKLK